jgi:hypothetical protein
MKLQKLLTFGLIPNHPDSNTNIFTHPIDKDSNNNLANDDIGFSNISVPVGDPREKKSACTTKTRNIAIILNNSILESRSRLN